MVKKTIWIPLILAIGAITLISLWLLSSSQPQQVAPTGNIQTIKLSSSPEGQYSPAIIKVKAGDTVRIEGDEETLVGGMDTIIVEGYEVSKKISPNDNILEFIADRPGEFRVRCANQMGNGKLIVE